MLSAEKSNAPPASFTGTPSTSTLANLLSPPRMNSDVAPPYEPVWTTAMPGTRRKASSTVVIPSCRSCSPATTDTDAGARLTASGDRVAVTTIGATRAVSRATCAEMRVGVATTART